jgi:hypothetical protein
LTGQQASLETAKSFDHLMQKFLMRRFIQHLHWWACLLLLSACHTAKKPPKPVYTVDPDTVWETLLLTPDGVHYGLDTAGVARHDLFRTAWLQRRSANTPYQYDKLQATVNCRDQNIMWLMRSVVENNEVVKVQTGGALEGWPDKTRSLPMLKWIAIETDSLESKLARKVCQATEKRKPQ